VTLAVQKHRVGYDTRKLRGDMMKRLIEGADRGQSTLLPECLEDWVDESNLVRGIDAFVDALKLAIFGFEGAQPAATGRTLAGSIRSSARSIGWLGVALTGSDTSSNVLFGGLQKITAEQLGINPVLMAASNSSGGEMGKMIDAQSSVVASTATKWYGHEARSRASSSSTASPWRFSLAY
jgi:hypothetical protein